MGSWFASTVAALGPPTTGRGARWPAGEDEARWGVPAAVACLLGAQLFAIVWAGAALGVLYGEADVPGVSERPIWSLLVLNIGLWAGYLLSPVLVMQATGSGRVSDFEVGTDARWGSIAAVVGVASQLVLLPILYLVILQLYSGDPGRSAEELVDRVDGPVDVALLVLAVVIAAPIVEEWFYRGMLLPTLTRRVGGLWAAVISSAVFALVHQDPIVMPGLFVLALILSWLTMRTGRLGPAILAHMAFNTTTVIRLVAL